MRLVIAITVLGLVLLAASSTGFVWWWAGEGGATRPDQIGAAAATVQAVSALLIIVLTGVLAWLAYGALAAAQTEAKAAADAVAQAREANLLLREDREIAVLPVLSVTANVTRHPDKTTGISLAVRNISSHPALRVSAFLLTGAWDRLPPNAPNARDHLLRDTPIVYPDIPGGEDRPFGWHIQSGDIGDDVVLRLKYTGHLGTEVWQTYELRMQEFKAKLAEGFLTDCERYIASSVPGAKPIVNR